MKHSSLRFARLLALLLCVACGSSASRGVAPVAAPAPQQLVPSPSAPVPAIARAKDTWHDAHVAAAAGHYSEAAQLFAQAGRLSPTLVSAWVNSAICWQRAGEPRQVQTALREAQRLGAKDVPTQSALAELLLVSGDAMNARAVLDDALRARPHDGQLLRSLAKVLRAQRQYDAAAEVAEQAIARDRGDKATLKLLALIYLDANKLPLAQTALRSVLRQDDCDSDVRVGLGIIAARGGDATAAMQEFAHAARCAPENPSPYLNMGTLALSFRDYARAADSLKKAVTLGSQSCEAVRSLGFALEGTGSGADAIEQFKRAYDLCDKDPDLLFAMGSVCLSQMQDPACALAYFERYTASKEGLAKDSKVFRLIESLRKERDGTGAPAPDVKTADDDAVPAG